MSGTRSIVNSSSRAAVFVLGLFVLTSSEAMAEQSGREIALIDAGVAQIEVTTIGTGHPLVFLPSLGRAAEDFERLAEPLGQAGFRLVLPEPRGIGRSRGPRDGLSMHDLAADVAAVIRSLGTRPVTVVGHAYGSRLARMVATDHPELVGQVILLGAGGSRVPIPAEILDGITQCFASLPRAEHLAVVGRVFFADGQDPAAWETGWYRPVMEMQRAASRATPADEWWAAGQAPVLVIQALDDVVSPPATARRLAEEFPERVQVVEIPSAGHAMVPEQPAAIAEAIIDYLRAAGLPSNRE